ncbi:AIPR family protein [Nocardia vinacea]|uniref:AIPR family protein n=1 Tax=Nocardia vinacea TaxID=96468 RepID=UPI00341D0711
MGKANADADIVNSSFKEFLDTQYPGERPDDVFERFVAVNLLSDKDLTPEDLERCVVDGSHDGGIDSFFVFLNGVLLTPDSPILEKGTEAARSVGRTPKIEFYLIQSKNQDSWKESAWEHLQASLPDLLDRNKLDVDLEKMYSSSVVEQTSIFRRMHDAFGTKFPEVSFSVAYATMAPQSKLTKGIENRADRVKKIIEEKVPSDTIVTVNHVGPTELYLLIKNRPTRPALLEFSSEVIREKHSSFIGIASISSYLSFIMDEKSSLRDDLFDFNVRDFEGDNTVNASIRETLKQADLTEFWWQNNGITILADRVRDSQRTLTIENPMIVNGLQTSHIIYNAFSDREIDEGNLKKGILVRVITADDEETRDRIIAGTNRQTRVPSPALFATQPLQFRIEDFFKSRGFFYERRKNRYKNASIAVNKRVTMNALAQAMITLWLGRPDEARARPSTILSNKNGYDDVFPDTEDLNIFLDAVKIMKAVDRFLSSAEAKNILDDKNNCRFYVAYGYAARHIGAKSPDGVQFDLNHDRIARSVESGSPQMKAILQKLSYASDEYQYKHAVPRDSMFKSGAFRLFFNGKIFN